MRKETIYNEVLSMLNDRIDYKSITLAEVANRCDIGKSTIYEYFKSKDEMLFNSILFYLNKMIKFFVNSFEITSFRISLKKFIKAVAITMKANFWLVYPWTFTDNYADFLAEEDADTISEMLDKSKDIIYKLFCSILKRGEEEDVLYQPDDAHSRFAFNGLISSLAETIDKDYDLSSDDAKMYVEDLCSCIVKQLN